MYVCIQLSLAPLQVQTYQVDNIPPCPLTISNKRKILDCCNQSPISYGSIYGPFVTNYERTIIHHLPEGFCIIQTFFKVDDEHNVIEYVKCNLV
jgi:hypothetical protein